MNEKNDSISAAKSFSKVSAKQKKTWIADHRLLALIGIVVLIILFILFDGHSTSNPPKKQRISLSVDNNNLSELSDNLARLQSMQLATTKKISPVELQPHASNAINGQYLARQNAPTAMYHVAVDANSNSEKENNTPFLGNDQFSSFGNHVTQASVVNAQQIAHPEYTIASGEFLHAVLETAIDSTLPGEIRAVVRQPVYAYVGEQPLIPAGSRLIGQYASSVFRGQDRVFVVWNRVILPNGVSAQLDSPGVDNLGRAGQSADEINYHFFLRFGEATLLSIIGAGAANAGVNTTDQYNSASEYRDAIAQSFQKSANKSIGENDTIQPTLTIYQGAAINVFVAHDVDFFSVMQTHDE